MRESTRHMEYSIDSIVIWCQFFPQTDTSCQRRGIESIRIKAFSGSKSNDVDLSTLNARLQKEITLRFLPCAFHQWKMFCASTESLKESPCIVPMTIYPEPGYVQSFSGIKKSELIDLSKHLDNKSFRRKKGIGSAVPCSGHPLREFAISYVPEELLEQSDTIVIVENAEKERENVTHIYIYANGGERVWEADKALDKIFFTNLESSGVGQLVEWALNGDIEKLCSEFASPLEDDPYKFFVILITKENGKFKLIYYFPTNKSQWFILE